MNNKLLITFIFGTRPEAIKLAPLIRLFRDNKSFSTRIVTTGQHKELLMDVLEVFEIDPDNNLNLMVEKQSLSNLNIAILRGLDEEFDQFLPNLIIVQGDTTTAYAASMAAFYRKIKIAHVEAGLRTGNLYSPFPEEANRRLIGQITDLHFAPTKRAEKNLLNSNVSGKVYVTGNTVIDALFYIANKCNSKLSFMNNWRETKFILVTVHRRENWGKNIENICDALKIISEKYPDINFVIPMHPNKIVRNTLIPKLGNLEKFHLIEPLKYSSLIEALKNCFFILTDSGGIQEEAPSLGKPVLVLRNNTERVEGIENGTAKLVGTEINTISNGISELITNSSLYQAMSEAVNPYGDGKASKRILKICMEELFHV